MTDAATASAPEAVESAADPQIAERRAAEVAALQAQARRIAWMLTVMIVVAFFAGMSIILDKQPLVQIAGIGLVGFAGSGVGALSSLLMRYSTGVELASGERVPANAEGEVYLHNMAFPLAMRPVLGALIAPLTCGAVMLLFSKHEEFKGSLEALMVVAFVGGLYAKSAIEASKNAFKVVFRA